MVSGKIIKVKCQCGFLLFRYFKDIPGRLIKCYLDEIREDNVGVDGLSNHESPACPSCGNIIGLVGIVHGRPAIKLSQGTIRKIRA